MVFHKKPLLNVAIVLVFFHKHFVGSFTQVLREGASPCPSTFQYDFENSQLIGRIRVECPGCKKVQLDVEFCVGNRVDESNGNIQLANSKEQVLQDILNKNPIYYKVYFPRWQGQFPKITKIILNGNFLCSGPKLMVGMVPIVTTINLRHTLTVDTVPLSSSSDPAPQNLPVPATPPFDIRQHYPPQDTTSKEEDYHYVEAEESPFYSPPPPPKRPFSPKNKYNFRPQIPADTSKIYPGNPFFKWAAANGVSANNFPNMHDNNVDDPRLTKRDQSIYETNPFLSTNKPQNLYQGNPFLVSTESQMFAGNPFLNREKISTSIFTTEVVPSTTQQIVMSVSQDVLVADKILSDNPFFTGLSSNVGDAVESPVVKPNNRPDLVQRISERPPVRQQSSVPERNPNFGLDYEIAPASRTPVISSNLGEIPYNDICGRSISTNSLILNGNAVPKGAYPWLVALFGIKDAGLNYMCSGSLISTKHVVTAAHCVKTESKLLKPQDLLCILGKLNIKRWVLGDGEKMIELEKIDIHPNYETMTSDADIAVLTLGEEVEFNKYIRPICLWSPDNELSNVVGSSGTVVGWGRDEHGNLMTAEPKQIALPIVSQEQCLRSNYQFQYITSNRTFCAGFRNGTGPCNGDSGSGLILNNDGRWMLKGIVSMSISESHTRTCDLSNYVVFTDASKHIEWLLSFIK